MHSYPQFLKISQPPGYICVMGDPERTVLVCPLNWGIGHATRCVPVIRKFLEEGFRVVIAADGRPLEFLKKEFPEVKCIVFPGSMIRYSRGSSMTLKLLVQLPGFFRNIRREHHTLIRLAREEKAGVVVSDNRYGVWSRDCRSILITHQLELELPPAARWYRPAQPAPPGCCRAAAGPAAAGAPPIP